MEDFKGMLKKIKRTHLALQKLLEEFTRFDSITALEAHQEDFDEEVQTGIPEETLLQNAKTILEFIKELLIFKSDISEFEKEGD